MRWLAPPEEDFRFAGADMTDGEIDAQIAHLEGMIEWLRGLKNGAQCAAVYAGMPTDLISAGEAAAIARRAKQTIGAWCRAHPINGEGGFSIKLRGRWFVSYSRLIRHLASVSSD